MKSKRNPACVLALTISASLGYSDGAVVLNQIGDLGAYNLQAAPGPTPSQIFTDFLGYDTAVLEDFTVSASDLKITNISALFRAQGGFVQFQNVQGYALNFFSQSALAANSLTGDVASLLVLSGSGASVTQIHGGGGEYGMVSLGVNVSLPAAGTYWVGVSPVSANSVTGQFLLLNSGATSPGNMNAKLANPGEGFGLGALSLLNLDYAYSVTAVPEPAASSLLILGGFAWLCRHRRPSGSMKKST
jgi:hypothetical protein